MAGNIDGRRNPYGGRDWPGLMGKLDSLQQLLLMRGCTVRFLYSGHADERQGPIDG
jgi:hypothetical protein